MYFEKRARQACAKFISIDESISLLRLRQFMYLLEMVTIIRRGQPLVNGTIVLDGCPQLKEIDESYLENLPKDDGYLSPEDCIHIIFIASGNDSDLKSVCNNHMKLYKKRFPDKEELDWIDVLRAHGTPEEEIQEYKADFEYYLHLLKPLKGSEA